MQGSEVGFFLLGLIGVCIVVMIGCELVQRALRGLEHWDDK